MTYKQRLNEKFGLDKDTEHSFRELKELTGVPINILKEVEKRGKGAYANNLGSVRLNDFSKNDDLRKGASKRLSMEQWSKARIYAFLFKSIFQNMKYKKQDMDLFEELKKNKIFNKIANHYCEYI
jgi:hypothetical protein